MTRFQRRAVRLVAVVVAATIASAGCVGPPPPDPGEPGIALDSPVGGSLVDFPVGDVDLCSPFTHPLFGQRVSATRASTERGPGSCRWQREGVTATITDEVGTTLAGISHDPRYRPGNAGIIAGNRFWATATRSSPPYHAHLFLAAGPAQPHRLLHVYVDTEDERVGSQQPDRSYTARALAEFIAECTVLRMSEVMLATTAPPPR